MKKFLNLVLFSIFLLSSIQLVSAHETVEMAVFFGQGCPHCAKMEDYINTELKQKFPGLKVKYYEIYQDSDNLEAFKLYAEAYGIDAKSVPTIFIGDQTVVGDRQELLLEKIEYFSQHPFDSPEQKVAAYQELQKYQQQTNQDSEQTADSEQSNSNSIVGWVVIIVGLTVFSGLIINKYLIKTKQTN